MSRARFFPPPQLRSRRLPLPKCIYCSQKARVGCHDCGAPMCLKCVKTEGGILHKCRDHFDARATFKPIGEAEPADPPPDACEST